jgi:signal transduction histidine kinase/ligand-binding sensor domain-containing protein
VFGNLNVDDGLAQSSVYSIFQDSKGYMWFGTGFGISRYDGTEVRSYTTVNTANKDLGINLTVRGKFVEDKTSNIWFANESGIFCYHRASDSIKLELSFAHKPNQNMWPGIIFLSQKGNIWIFNYASGVLTYHIKARKSKYYAFELPLTLEKTSVRRPVFVPQNDRYIWFSRHRNDGIFRHDIETQKTEQFFKGKEYVNLTFSGKKIFLSSAQSIDIYNLQLKKEKTIKLPKFTKLNSIVNAVLIDHRNRIWITIYQEGLFCYLPKTNSFVKYQSNKQKLNALSSNLCTTLQLDNTRNLWIGTDGGGVCRLDLKAPLFNVYPQQSADKHIQLEDYFTKCLLEDNEKKIWFGTANNGIGVLDKSTQSLEIIKYNNQHIPLTNIGAIFQDSRQQIWVGLPDGIGIYNRRNKTINKIELIGINFTDISNSNFVFKFIETPDKQILAATKIGLIAVTQKTSGKFIGKPLSNHIALKNTITDIEINKKGEILFSTASDGFYIFSRIDKLNKPIYHLAIHQKINCFSIDAKNPKTVWIGTDNALIQLNTTSSKLKLYNEKDGLNNSYIYGILEDNFSNLWISTNGGISRFDQKKQRFVNYTFEHGLQSNEFNARAYHKAKSGQLYFGGINGFNWFKPEELIAQSTSYQPKTIINSITLNETETINTPSGKVELPYWKNQLNIQFAVLDFTSPAANQINYQLIGADKHSIVSKNKNIRYHNLQPGKYLLKYQGINGYQSSSKVNLLEIVINPPFWKTWWFFSLVGLIGVLLIVFLTKQLTNRKLRQRVAWLEKEKMLEEERQRIAREMHDDIAAGLTQINMISRKASANKDVEIQKELKDIVETSNHLTRSMNDIIWNLTSPLAFPDFINHIVAMAKKTIAYSNIEYDIEVSPELYNNLYLSPEKQRNIVLITQEILHNAIKYSKASHILLQITIVSDSLRFLIRDNGIGCDFDETPKGNGLKNIQYRIAQISGVLNHKSREGEGCEFMYSVRID